MTGKPKVVGFLVAKEIEFLSDTIRNPASTIPRRLGGAKVSDKINVIKNLLDICDKVLIGGAMAYTFSLAQGGKVGKSLVEPDKVELAKQLLETGKDKLVYRSTPIAPRSAHRMAKRKWSRQDKFPTHMEGFDIGPLTMQRYPTKFGTRKTVVWKRSHGDVRGFSVRCWYQSCRDRHSRSDQTGRHYRQSG